MSEVALASMTKAGRANTLRRARELLSSLRGVEMLHALSAQADRTRWPALKDAAARVAVCGERGSKNSLPWTRFVCCIGAPGAPNVDKSASQVLWLQWSTICRYHGQIARVCWRLEYRYYESG